MIFLVFWRAGRRQPPGRAKEREGGFTGGLTPRRSPCHFVAVFALWLRASPVR